MQSQDSKNQETHDPDRSRVVVEKPFGHDPNLLVIYSLWLSDIYAKNEYRMTYLGKDTVNNILATTLSKYFLEPLKNRQYIDEIQIFASGLLVVKDALNMKGWSNWDDAQNHILQIMLW